MKTFGTSLSVLVILVAIFLVACGEDSSTEVQVQTSDIDISCSTEPLKDSSGVKIICNGDSIGVVLNGIDGKDGTDGKDGSDGKNGKNGKNGKDGKDGNDGKGTERMSSLQMPIR